MSNMFKSTCYEYEFKSYKFKSDQFRVQIHKFKNHYINENSCKQPEELVKVWIYLCGLSGLIWKDMQNISWSYIFFNNYF